MPYDNAISMDDPMPFGKYQGTEVEEILLDDPKYLLWLAENTNTVFDNEVLEAISKI